jgi:hypothetical protein
MYIYCTHLMYLLLAFTPAFRCGTPRQINMMISATKHNVPIRSQPGEREPVS